MHNNGVLTARYLIDKLCRLMSPDLPLTIEPKRLARKGEIVAGQYAIDEMQRLGGLLHDQSGQVTFRLEFTHDDEKKTSFIMGNIHAVVNIVCQRCLGPMPFTIDNQIYLGIIREQDDEYELPDGCEPLIASDESVNLASLIEDEVILALPIVTMHDEKECNATELLTEINSTKKESPFAVLKTLAEKSDK